MARNVVYKLRRINYSGDVIIGNPDQSYTCGRGKENEIVCPSMLVSRRHCIFIIHSDGLYIRDLGSSNGVYINGVIKRRDTKLNPDDIIGLGVPDTDPVDISHFIYCLEIIGNNHVVENAHLVVIAPPPPPENRPVVNPPEKTNGCEKKRPGEVNDKNPPRKLRKISVKESCVDAIERISNHDREGKPCSSFASNVASIDINSIKPDPDDDVIVLEYIPEQNDVKTLAGRVTKDLSYRNEPIAGPSGVSSKPAERSKVVQSKVFNKSNKLRPETSEQSSEEREECHNKTVEKPTESSKTTASTENWIKSCKIIITRIETIPLDEASNRNSQFSRDNNLVVKKNTVINKTDGNINLKYGEPKVSEYRNHSKELECSVIISKINVDQSRSINSKLDKKNSENNQLTNGHILNSNCKKRKDESLDISVSSHKNVELSLARNSHGKVERMSEFKHNENISKNTTSSAKSTYCDKPASRRSSNFFMETEDNKELKYESDDDDGCEVVNEVMNNGNCHYIDNSTALSPRSEKLDNSRASTSSPIKLKPVKEEPKTSYSEIDTVFLSSDEEDEENVFPCSQLFTSADEEPTIKQEPTKEEENEIQQPSEDYDVIFLSDSDEEENNPWFNRLFNSQVYRPSQDFCVKTELKEVNDTCVDSKKELDVKLELEILENGLPFEVEGQDDDVWDDNIQSQETAAKEVRSFDTVIQSQRKKVDLIEGKEGSEDLPKIGKLFEERKKERKYSEDERQKQKKHENDRESRRVSLDRTKKSDSEGGQEKRKGFEIEREKRRDFNENRENRRNYYEDRGRRRRFEKDRIKRRDSDDDQERWRASEEGRERRRVSDQDRERRRTCSEDRGRRKIHDENRGRRKESDEGRERCKASDEGPKVIQGRKKENERCRERKNNHENNREINKENEENQKRMREADENRLKKKRNEEYQAIKKEKEKEENRTRKNKDEEDYRLKRRNEDNNKKKNEETQGKKRNSEGKNNKEEFFDFAKNKTLDSLQEEKKSFNNIPYTDEISKTDWYSSKMPNGELHRRKSTNESSKRLLDDSIDSVQRTQNVQKEMKIESLICKNALEGPSNSKISENVQDVLNNKPSFEESMATITTSIKAKMPKKKGPLIIEAPSLPKGENRGVSVTVCKNNNEYSEASILTGSPRKRSTSKNRILMSEHINTDPKVMKRNRLCKLKQLTENKPSVEEEAHTTHSDRPRAKAIAKITHKSRQDAFVIEHQKSVPMKPGIASQRINNNQPIAHCSKSIPEMEKVPRNKGSSCRMESNYQEIGDKPPYRMEDEYQTTEGEEEVGDLLDTINCAEFYDVSPPDSTEINDCNDITYLDNSKNAADTLKIDSLKINGVTKNIDTTKKPRKSCLSKISFHSLNGKEKKTVTWNLEDNQIKVFDIDANNSLKKSVLKDAPLPKLRVEHDIKQEFLSRIFVWNPTWLEEQKTLPFEPPVQKSDPILQMKNRYSSYLEYCNILRPLLLLEIWNSLTKESECEEKKYKFRSIYCSIVENSVLNLKTTGGDYQTTFNMEILISNEDLKREMYPGVGHLILIEFPYYEEIRDLKGHIHKKPCFRRIFAYITKKNQTQLGPNTNFNRDLRKFLPSAEVLVNFKVFAKPNLVLPTMTICRMRGVMYLKSNMREIQALQSLPASPLKSLILTPSIDEYQLPEVCLTETNPLVTKDDLNPKQIEAVLKITEGALSNKANISLIHGPPGTGKSKVIVNIVTQILIKFPEAKILVCAPSNAAVDELVLRLLDIRSKLKLTKEIRMVRVGRPETMNPRVKNISLEELGKKQVEKDYDYSRNSHERKKYEAELAKLETFISLAEHRILDVKRNGVKGDISMLKMKLKDLQTSYDELELSMGKKVDLTKICPAEYNKLHRKSEQLLLLKATIIACTLSSCYSGIMEKLFGEKNSENNTIPICIVDEATQSCETETLIPLMLGVKKLILVGDTNQLPATVLSKKAKEMGLDKSLFSRIQNTFGEQKENPIIMLDTQYRMDYPIALWPNLYFYKGKLKNKATVKEVPYCSYKVLNLNSNQDKNKFSNTSEAEFVSKIIYVMATFVNVTRFDKPIKIGVITPYQNQRHVIMALIERRLEPVPSEKRNKFIIEVNTVDSFQGQERDVIIMSCVRSSGIGFMSDKQRLCVALTRAKSSLILCGNFRTFQKDEMWNALLSDAKRRDIFIDVPVSADLQEIKSHILR